MFLIHHRRFYNFILIILMASGWNALNAQTLAFPGAEGYGRFATGGRGGQVVTVSNLNDSGEGSFREALDAFPGQPLTIVFNVSGIIELKSPLTIRRSDLTIAGQTAPGDGICLKGNSFMLNGAGKGGNKGNIIIRFIRSRPGGTLAKGLYGFDMENCHDVIIDHCSFSWANEECAALYDNRNTTVQWCIVSEGLYNAGHAKGTRAYGGVWGGQYATYHHNLIAHQNSRTVRFNGARAHDTTAVVDYYNNVIYNWASANAAYGGDVKLKNGISMVNMVNNYYLPGPASPDDLKFIHALYDASNATGVGQWFLSGNVMKGNRKLNANNSAGIDLSEVPASLRTRAIAIKPFGFDISTSESADKAFNSVLAGAGAIYPTRDAVDIRIVKETAAITAKGNGSSGKAGIIDSPSAVGGWPEYKSAKPLRDTDGDGMPDEWENKNGLDPADASDRNKLGNGGYTMLENYLNSLVKDQTGEQITILLPEKTNPRIKYGADQLTAALTHLGYRVEETVENGSVVIGRTILIKSIADPAAGKEGFSIGSKDKQIVITGNDESGTMYGCLELAERIKENGNLPQMITLKDRPEMVLRGACIGIQKPVYLPGRHVYEYPYTPETFPWLYDKGLWIQYLDSLATYRMNALFLWNGHPFASLVKLKDYPYAVEVDDSTFKKNEEIYQFITQEADRRGIWVIQMFYNIIVSKPFAEKHNIKTQDRNRPIIPLIADYTRKSIAAFVEKYPNVGLMVALGEAMEGVGNDDVEWFTKTIIPGVKDGLKALGKTEEPPIVLRAHDTDAPMVMKAALPLYKNLYTEAKYNGEALTTYTPRGPWAELHRNLSRIGTVQIENVHILANLEPFRYGSADFIQKSVLAMHRVHEGNGLHLYPQASYWDWPYTADNTSPRLLQIERDWIWYKQWARYAWKADRNRLNEINYWARQLLYKFGGNTGSAKNILEAYEQTGEIAPKLLRRFGITDGNRQTLTLGMLMTQLINPYRYGLFTLLYNSEGPEGEMLTEYAEKEWNRKPHTGETPVQIINEVVAHGNKAVAAIEKAAPLVTANKEEFERVKNDMYIYQALANHFAEKATAALLILRYKYSNDLKDLEAAMPHLEYSVSHYSRLAELTKDTYLYANSMQTQQRKIPVGGDDGTNKTWVELLKIYEKELSNFKNNLDSLKSPDKTSSVKQKAILENADVKLVSPKAEHYDLMVGREMFADTATYFKDFAEELKSLKGLKLSRPQQMDEGTTINFTAARPVKLLVGFFNSKDPKFLQPPQLETDASANNYGQAEPKISNAIIISGMPPVNIHTYSFKAGTHSLKLGKGTALILGFVNDDQLVRSFDAGLIQGGVKRELDWLFE
ncbi:MAG TPA: glycoside hydrolase family 20 zincin-like fold domain-containing protein [Chitinophagaceae bacterium]